MNNIRESVHDLRDESIDVKTAVLEMAEPLKDRFEVRLDCEVESVYMPKDIKYATINIIKESVSNIMKYSKSDTVDIRIDEHPSMYQIIVRDYRGSEDRSSSSWTDKSKNDIGYTEVEIKPGEGMGLENIRLRAEKLGGQARFVSGNGFRVFVRIPKPKDVG
jgi:signal transduction histidine kinase